MSKKIKCPSCGTLIDVNESQQCLHCSGCGKYYKNPHFKGLEEVKEVGTAQVVAPAPVFVPVPVATPIPVQGSRHSEFNAGLLSLIGLNIVNNIILFFTLGFGMPWVVRREYTWLYEHQVIDDKKLAFEGKAASLFGQWVKWMLLSIITLGIYSFLVPLKEMQWVTKNTHIQNFGTNGSDNRSEFDGKFWSFWGMRFVNALIVVFTLGICTPWAIVREQRWLAEHRVFDGQRLVFDGKASGLIGHWIKWMLLSIITLGIYALWIPIKKQKWITAHTHFAN